MNGISGRVSDQERIRKQRAKEVTQAGKLNPVIVALLLAGLDFLSAGALQQGDRLCTLPAALFLILWLQKKRIDWRRGFANCSIYRSRVSDGFDGDLVGTLSSNSRLGRCLRLGRWSA